jgi:hypothetical protein
LKQTVLQEKKNGDHAISAKEVANANANADKGVFPMCPPTST